MIDRAANANFLAGVIFGGALLIAAIVLALVIFMPIGRSDWVAFIRGATILPGIVIAMIGLIAALLLFTANKA